ncbi:MAG: DUF4214 domain-containing protein, partial [Bryobacteraceae bacterium]|nr:DUF4214 domain-containing protein [Bryobacteraceae bacterium]
GLPVIVGSTGSLNFPLVNALQSTYGGAGDAFVAKLNGPGTGFVFSTYFGGARSDSGLGLSLDSANNVYLAGLTGGRLATANAIKPLKSGGSDLLIRGSAATFTGADSGIVDSAAISVVASDPANTQVLLAASGSTLFRSTNQGTSWTKVDTLIGSIFDIVPAPATAGAFLAGTTTGLYRSLDGGQTWTPIYTAASVFSVSVDPASSLLIAAGTPGGLIRSTNGGAIWTTSLAGSEVNHVSMDPRNSAIVLAATNTGVQRSTNGGTSFTSVLAGAWRKVLLAPSNPDIVYAFSGTAVQRSANNGQTFAPRNLSPVLTETAWVIDPANPDVVYAGSEYQGLFRTTDGATSWTLAATSYSDASFETLHTLPNGTVFAGLRSRLDGFAAKLNAAGTQLLFSTYLGGAGDDYAGGIAVGPGGFWVAGDGFYNFPVNAGTSVAPQRGQDTFLVRVSEAETPCTYEVQSTQLSFDTSSRPGSFNILTGSGCAWSGATAASWIHFTTPASGTGTGSIAFTVDANVGGARSADVTIADKTLTVSQTGAGCSYSLNPVSISPAAAGGSVNVALTTAAGCTWSIVSNFAWLTSSGATSGTGSATVAVNVAPNSSSPRTGSVLIGNASLSVTQAGSACTLTLSRTSDAANAAGSSGSFTVSVSGVCNYTIASSATWLTITSGATGSGNGTVSWTAAANNTGVARLATITAGDRVVQIAQAAAAAGGCTFTPTVVSVTAGSPLQAGTIVFTASSPSCTWRSTSAAPWLQLTPETGTGTTTIFYTIYPNLTPRSRNTTASLPGVSVPISQAGSTLSADERFVTQMYFNFFGRMPAPNEVAFHVGTLNTGQHTRASFVSMLYNTQEFNFSGRFIGGLYVGLLARDAEFGGWLFQRNALAGNQVNQLSLVSNFLNAPEYALTHGSPSNEQFVRLLYRYILLREAAADEVAFHAGSLSFLSRIQVGMNFLNSPEFQITAGPRLTTALLYATLLSRDATPAEFTNLVNTLTANPAAVPTLIPNFLNSAEFGQLLN